MATTAQGNERTMEDGTNGNSRWWNILRVLGWSFAGLMVLFPAVAMQFTDEVNWGAGDFLLAIVLLGGAGLVGELVLRRSNNDAYRTGALLALGTMFLLIWSNAAVGFVGSGANTANVLYVALLAIPIIGGFVSGFKPKGMSISMVATAVVQAAIAVYAFAADLVSHEEGPGIAAVTAIFTVLWIGAAVLFHAAWENLPHNGKEGSNRSRLCKAPIGYVLSALLTAIGMVLLVLMITVESEPGLVPLLLVLVGTGWFLRTHHRARAS